MGIRGLSQPEVCVGTPNWHMRSVRWFAGVVVGIAVLLGGCGKLRPKPKEHYVYVTAKQTFLRDRVAAVSNRTGTVSNGDRLVVLEHSRRFVKVRTAQGEVGWIDEKAVATEEVAGQFDALAKEHAKDPVVGNATVRDEVYVHVAPGRDTERFFRLNEGDKLSLLSRASLEKVVPGGAPKPAADAKGKDVPAGPLPPVMEDWWLVRDGQGHTGWLYSRMMDVDAPDALVRYAEGQRIVGAYILDHVNDPESGVLKDGQVDPDVPEYVTVLGPYKAGQPYDFDQVRVFYWNLKKHRYETAFRERNIAGYLPVTVKKMTDPYGKAQNATTPMPGFSYRLLAAGEAIPSPDPKTGVVKPGKLVEKTYRLEGNTVRRILQPGTQGSDVLKLVVEDKKDKKKRKK